MGWRALPLATSRCGMASRSNELTSEAASLEQAFMELTADDVEFRAQDPNQVAHHEAAPVAASRKG